MTLRLGSTVTVGAQRIGTMPDEEIASADGTAARDGGPFCGLLPPFDESDDDFL